MSHLLLRLRAALAGRYEIHHRVGGGGMGTVFLAVDVRHQRPVAIKVLHPDIAAVLGTERFLREIEIAASLSHPNLLPLHDSGVADDLFFYVMPYVAGGSLRQRLDREKQLPIKEAVAIAREVADGLACVHAHGVVHRDVKPENILLEEGHAVVADFGVARALPTVGRQTLTEPGLAIGTPAYMSPEQAGGSPDLDGRSDMYSLACVLYEMLAGEPPFSGLTPQAVIARHMQDVPRSLRTVRPSVALALEAAILAALGKVPADRFATMSRFSAALLAAGEAKTPARPRSMLRQVGAMAVVLLGVAGAYRIAREPPAGLDSTDGEARASAPSDLAVLYFEDRSEDGKLDYLAAGLTEDLIDRLASVRGLRVISPDGVRPYRGKGVPLDSIARAFSLGTIVTGTLSRSGTRLRASVRLTDAANGVQLFSGSIEKPFGDVLALRDQLAEEVARQLRIRLGEAVQIRERRAGTSNPAAWNLVQQAEQLRDQAQQLPEHDPIVARSLYRQADSLLVAAEGLDGSWPEPTVLRGWLAYDQSDLAAAAAPSADSRSVGVGWIRQGIEQAQRALRKDPKNPEPLELRGSLRYRGWVLFSDGRDTDMRLDLAERDLRAAASIPLRSHARTLSTLSGVLLFLGKVVEANQAAQRAYEADAYLRDADVIVLRLFSTSLSLGRDAEARKWCDLGRRSFPRHWTFLMCQLTLMAWSTEEAPDVRRGWAIIQELDSVARKHDLAWVRPQMTMILAAVLARAGREDSAERLIARLNSQTSTDPDLVYYEALARVRLGQVSVAARLLAQQLRESPKELPYLRSDSRLRPLWDDPQLRAYR